MSNEQKSDIVAWKKVIETKNGPVEVLNVVVGTSRYTMWPNTFKKEGEKSPDYRGKLDTYEPKAAATPVASFVGQDTEELPF